MYRLNYIYIYIYIFFFFFLALLGLCHCKGFSLVAVSRGYSPVAVFRLLAEVAPLVVEHGSRARGLLYLQLPGSRAQTPRLWRMGLVDSLVAQTVKRLPAIRETQVQSLGREDPLEKQMATHSSTLAWKIPWMEEPGGLQSMGSQS